MSRASRPAVAAAALSLLMSASAHADPPSSPSATRVTGIGFTATGVVLFGTGGYFIYRANQRDDAGDGRLGLALLAGGVVCTGVGIALILSAGSDDATPRQAVTLGPGGLGYFRAF